MTRQVFALACLILLAGCATVEKEYRAASAELVQGRLPEAQKRIDECLERRGSSLTARDRWRLQLLKADVLLARGKTQDALPLVSNPVPPADWSAPLELRRKVILATALGRTRRRDEALDLLRSAETEAERLGDQRTLLEIANIRAPILMATGRRSEAEICLTKAAASARLAHDDYWLAGALVNLAYLKTQIEFRHDEAVRLGEEAIAAAKRAGAIRLLSVAYINTSQALMQLGSFDRAIRYRKEVLELQRQVDDQRQIRANLGEMGNIYALQERSAEAVEWYRQAFEYSIRTGGIDDAARSAGNLALAFISLGKWEEAETWNRRATELKQKTGAGLGYQKLNSAAIALARGQFAEAGRLYREVLAEEGRNPGLQFEAETGLARLSAKSGTAAEARKHFETAVRLVESNRDAIVGSDYQIMFLARMIRVWRQYVEFLIAGGRPEAAFEVAERSRAQVLAEKLRTHYSGVRTGVTIARLRQIAARRNCILVSYWLAPERSYAWIIDASGLHTHVLPPAGEIDRLVTDWRSRIEDQPGEPLETGRRAGDRLAELLLRDVKPASGKLLVVVPDGSLNQLNLETLPVPGLDRYLLEDATVVLSPSLEVFAAGRTDPPPAQRKWLLVGVGQPGDESYPPLPMAEEEVRSIAAHCPESERLVITGSAASPAAIRRLDMRSFGLIHFAAHAEANRESPLDSAVILARGGEESKLYARDLAAMSLNADLVTLSACRTAGARAYSGEGLLGLTWAVLSGGARSAIGGLWPVSDRATAALMEKMYAAIASGKTPPSALREAKLALRHSNSAFRQPYYWASFQIYVQNGGF